MKDFKYNYTGVRPNAPINKPPNTKSPQINFSIASKNNSLLNKILGRTSNYEANRQGEKSPIPNSYVINANSYANNANNYSNSKSPLKLLNYLYSKQQENNKKTNLNINSNAKQFIQMKLQNDSVNAVYQINLKKNSHNRAQSMHRDPQAQSMHRDPQATDERREKEINNSKERINDKTPLKIIKNFSDNKSYIFNRKSSVHEKNNEDNNRRDIMKISDKYERNNNNHQEKIDFKIGKSFEKAPIEKQILEYKRRPEEEKIKILVQKQKEEQEILENNIEENVDNHNKNYNFEPFVNFSNFKSIQMKPKVKEHEPMKIAISLPICSIFNIEIFFFNNF